jgi:predicted nucleic acid-binding protein
VVLVDTSVWIEVFRRAPRVALEDYVDIEDVVTCLPVVQEVLQGFRDEAAFQRARRAMQAMSLVESPLRAETFLDAAGLYRAARRSGLTLRSGVDCLIAACALRHHVTVLHHDRDYDAIARVSPLDVRRVNLR